MPKIIPITDMRDTNSISELCASTDEPIFVTKNGYGDMVVMSISVYEKLTAKGKKSEAKSSVSEIAPCESGEDPIYKKAVRIAVKEKRISTSLLQRKLEIGYSRAAKVIDRMQEDGYVTPPNGSEPRKILLSEEKFHEIFGD